MLLLPGYKAEIRKEGDGDLVLLSLGVSTEYEDIQRRKISEVISEYKKRKGWKCINAMRFSYREVYGDNTFGLGRKRNDYPELMFEMRGKGYLIGNPKSFSFDSVTLKNVKRLQESVASYIRYLGVGVYALSVGDHTHTMTITFDGHEFNLLDQGYMAAYNLDSVGLDTAITNTAISLGGIEMYGNYSSELILNKLKF